MRRALVLFSLLIVSGCGKEEPIVRYKAPKDPSWRTVGAILPRPEEVWFLKMVGSSHQVGAHREAFLAFVKTVKFGQSGMEWTVPEGWKEEKGRGTRYATLRFGEDKPLMEVSIVRLPGDAGGIHANVNRWRGQLGLDPAAAETLDQTAEKIQIAGREALIVDLVGPLRPVGRPPMRGGGMEASRREPPSRSPGGADLEGVRSLFEYTLPADWVKSPSPEGRRIFEFKTVGGRQSAIVTFNILPGNVGGLAANVNRWRNQVGMGSVGDTEAHASASHFEFLASRASEAHGAHLVELLGKERAILCVFRLSDEFSMFLKMDGPPEIVRSQREAFRTFARSMSMGSRDE